AGGGVGKQDRHAGRCADALLLSLRSGDRKIRRGGDEHHEVGGWRDGGADRRIAAGFEKAERRCCRFRSPTVREGKQAVKRSSDSRLDGNWSSPSLRSGF